MVGRTVCLQASECTEADRRGSELDEFGRCCPRQPRAAANRCRRSSEASPSLGLRARGAVWLLRARPSIEVVVAELGHGRFSGRIRCFGCRARIELFCHSLGLSPADDAPVRVAPPVARVPDCRMYRTHRTPARSGGSFRSLHLSKRVPIKRLLVAS